ncbi:MAG: hypothetical protein ACTH8M_08410 [Microbacterium gubbeenense]
MTDLATRRRSGPRWVRRGFVAPTVLVTVVLGLYPLIFIVGAAVTESSLGKPFQSVVGADQIVAAATDAGVIGSLVRGTLYALVVAAASTILGTAAALALWR